VDAGIVVAGGNVLRILRMSSLDNSPVWTYILTDSARRCLGAKLSLNINDDHLSNHGEAGDSGEQTATEDGTQSPPPAEETSVTPANLAPEPSGVGIASKKAGKPAADAIPENKSSFAGNDFSTQRAILMCHSLPTRHVYNFVEVHPRSCWRRQD
jgi:hypothetical protein